MADKLGCGTRNGFMCVTYNIFYLSLVVFLILRLLDKGKSKKMIKLFAKAKICALGQ